MDPLRTVAPTKRSKHARTIVPVVPPRRYAARWPGATRRMAQGFTLLETVMVLMLLALLTMLIATAFGVTQRADMRTERWNQSLQTMDAAQSYLRRALMSARPVAPLPYGRIAQTHGVRSANAVFTGDAASMFFFAPAPMVQEASGPKGNTLRIVDLRGHRWLVLQLTSLRPDRIDTDGGMDADADANANANADAAWGDEQTLAGPLSSGNFAYSGVDAQGRSTGWLNRWPWPNRLPRRVRIQLQVSQGMSWQTMTIPLLLQNVDQQGGT